MTVKVLTGDNELVTRTVCQQVGLAGARDPRRQRGRTHSTTRRWPRASTHAAVFVRLTPAQKARVIGALHRNGHVVGFLGDGINDGPALRAADVGISVDTAVDIAKESADIMLLEKSLLVLDEGVIEGRKVFGNIVKYMRMGASSNFGNMFSVLGASVLLPFLPMAPMQVLTNNLLYDFSQTAIADRQRGRRVPRAPRPLGHRQHRPLHARRSGPVSSMFDYVTFARAACSWRAHGGNAALFQSAWFVESLLSQTLVVHVIRTRQLPFVQSVPSMALAGDRGARLRRGPGAAVLVARAGVAPRAAARRRPRARPGDRGRVPGDGAGRQAPPAACLGLPRGSVLPRPGRIRPARGYNSCALRPPCRPWLAPSGAGGRSGRRRASREQGARSPLR